MVAPVVGDRLRRQHGDRGFDCWRGAVAPLAGQRIVWVEMEMSVASALADVLEKRKRLLKQYLLSRDESALFAIANNFELRHLNEQQKSDYDAAFLNWVF